MWKEIELSRSKFHFELYGYRTRGKQARLGQLPGRRPANTNIEEAAENNLQKMKRDAAKEEQKEAARCQHAQSVAFN